MNKETIQKKIHQGRQKVLQTVFTPRDHQISSAYLKLHKIIAFIGARRVGKTTLMIQYIHELIAQNIIHRDQVVFLDFTDSSGEQLDAQIIIDAYHVLHPHQTPWFFFDEIQNIDNFMQSILSLYTQNYRICITGSNSKVLSSELATELRGRSIDITVSPLSFREYLIFHNYSLTNIDQSNPLYIHHANNYIMRGGYPEIALNPNNTIQQTLIQSYLESLLYKDLQERYHIRSLQTLKHLIKKIIVSNTKGFSTHKIYNELKSMGIAVSKDTLYNYLEYIHNSFFYTQINPYLKPTGQSKLYLNDRAYMNTTSGQGELGQKWENLVYNHLIKQSTFLSYTSHPSYELDFLIEDNTAIQVCHTLTPDNHKREMKAFLHADFSTTKKLLYTPQPPDPTITIPSGVTIITLKDMIIQ